MNNPDKSWRARFDRTWITPQGMPGFSFDAVIRESHTSKLKVTENPVETGRIIADHAFMTPLELEIEGAVGDVWLHRRPDVPQGATWPGSDNADPFASPSGRGFTAFKMLQDLQASAVPFQVQTGLKLYSDMVIESLSAEQDAATSAILVFKATLKEVIRVSTENVLFTPRAPGPTHNQGTPTATAGQKPPVPVEKKEEEQYMSLLKSGKENLMSLLSGGL